MVLVLSGPVHGGKTTFLERSLPRWTARGVSCAGFLSPAVTAADGEKGYDLLELQGGGLWPALRETVGRPERRILLVAREEILEDLAAVLAPVVPLVFDIRDPDVQELLDENLLGTVKPDDGQS